LKDIYGVKLEMSADLGRCTMLVREVLELKRGSVLPLDKLAGEMTDIHINGIPFGRGEVVVLADTLHVRISEIHNPRGQYDK
jgi:flagellar motor switch protein FliN/FliY